MASKISFVREYEYSTEKSYDIMYKSGRLFMCSESTMPKTVKAFIENANVREVQYDKIYSVEEIIYYNEEKE